MKKYTSCLVLLAAIITTAAFGQTKDSSDSKSATRDPKFQVSLVAGITGTGLEVGYVVASGSQIGKILLTGMGIELGYPIARGHVVRASARYRSYSGSFIEFWADKEIGTDWKYLSTPVLGLSYDYFPLLNNESKFLQSVKITGGAHLYTRAEYQFESRLLQEIKWGQLTFTPEEVGQVNTQIRSNKIQPFLAIGFDRMYAGKSPISVGFDAGVFRQGKPAVSMQANNMLEATVSQAGIIQYNLRTFEYLPYVNLKLSYTFR